MSLYNLLHGQDASSEALLQELGKTKEDFPRFRDCYLGKRAWQLIDDFPLMLPTGEQHDIICVLTRTGGNNRKLYQEYIDEIRTWPLYVGDEDDAFDSTYMTFFFRRAAA